MKWHGKLGLAFVIALIVMCTFAMGVLADTGDDCAWNDVTRVFYAERQADGTWWYYPANGVCAVYQRIEKDGRDKGHWDPQKQKWVTTYEAPTYVKIWSVSYSASDALGNPGYFGSIGGCRGAAGVGELRLPEGFKDTYSWGGVWQGTAYVDFKIFTGSPKEALAQYGITLGEPTTAPLRGTFVPTPTQKASEKAHTQTLDKISRHFLGGGEDIAMKAGEKVDLWVYTGWNNKTLPWREGPGFSYKEGYEWHWMKVYDNITADQFGQVSVITKHFLYASRHGAQPVQPE